MTPQQPDLERLELVIGRILRAGVALAAVIMIAGLALRAGGVPAGTSILNGGLILMMMIPSARILASFGDALYRRDWLLASVTAVVSIVIAEEVFRKLFF